MVAHSLRLDYSTLKEHVNGSTEGSARQRKKTQPRFVELIGARDRVCVFGKAAKPRVQATSNSKTISCNAACVLRKKKIHVISDAIAELMADGPHTI